MGALLCSYDDVGTSMPSVAHDVEGSVGAAGTSRASRGLGAQPPEAMPKEATEGEDNLPPRLGSAHGRGSNAARPPPQALEPSDVASIVTPRSRDGAQGGGPASPSSGLKSSLRGGAARDSNSPRKKLQIQGRSTQQLVPRKLKEEQDSTIVCGKYAIKRTGSYATLGLGYIVDHDRHEQELARRSTISRPSVFGEAENAQGSMCMPLDVGSVLFEGHYDILEEIGMGGFSTVYKAAAKGGGKVCAVKKVRMKSLDHCNAVDLFRTETSISADLEHPNIAWRHQLFQQVDCLYFVMDLLAGPSLFERLSTSGVVSKRVACRYLHEMLSGLAYIHGHGIMHRDVKPENFISEHSRPDAALKLVDFGVSRLFQQGEAVSTLVGTLAYVAPEVVGGSYSEKCDVWSCGCTLFLCCCGSQPMMAFNDELLLELIRDGRVAWQLISWIDARLLAILKQMLQKDAAVRPSASQLSNTDWLRAAATAQPSCCGLF